MKIVVIGGTGLIGSKVVACLDEEGHEAVAASPDSGVNTLTGEGLAEHRVGLAIVLGGPALFLLGESLFQWRTTGLTNAKRLAAAGLIIGLAPLGTQVSALMLAVVVTVVLTALAISEERVSARRGRTARMPVAGGTS